MQENMPHLVLQETAAIVGVVNASAALAITALSANVVIAIHIASGSGSTHTSSASSDIINALQIQRLSGSHCKDECLPAITGLTQL